MSERPPKSDFTQSAEFHAAGNPPHERPSDIVTNAEVDRLEAMRMRAEPHPALRPDNFDHAKADSGLSKANEWRLERHKQRLMVARTGMRLDRLRSVHAGRAKAAFNVKSQDKDQARSSTIARGRD